MYIQRGSSYILRLFPLVFFPAPSLNVPIPRTMMEINRVAGEESGNDSALASERLGFKPCLLFA